MNKSLIGLIGSAVLTLIGVYLRLNTFAIAGPGDGSVVEPQAIAIGQVGIVLLAGGILLLIVIYTHWLFAKESDK